MSLHPADLDAIAHSCQELIRPLRSQAASPAGETPAPSPLEQTIQQLLELLRQLEIEGSSARPPDSGEIQRLGEYTIGLLADLAALAGGLGLEQQGRELEALCLPLALWIVRQGGALSLLEPVVNALAHLANSLTEPLELAALYETTEEIQRAVVADLQQDLEKSDPTRPWRILLLNRAIIATRSHRPGLIEAAYENLLQYLPEEAPGFFREGMGQMEALDYPRPVREVVERYYRQWGAPRTLH